MKFQTLGSLIEQYGGLIQTGPFGSQLHQRDYTAEGIPAVMPKDIQDGRVNEATVARISEQKAQQLSRHILKAGSIVFPRRGEINKCAYIGESQAGFLCGTGCLKIEPPADVLSSKFLFYYLRLRHVVEWLERNAVGTTMLNLNSSIIAGISVPVIDKFQQDKIVSILSAYDDSIENNRRRIKLLEQSARILYKEWFVSLRFPGHEHVEVKDGVPHGWEKKRLADWAILVMGQSPASEYYNSDGDGLPFHQGVTNFGDRFVEHKTYCKIEGRIGEAGDILCSVRAPVGRLNITLDRIVIGRGLSAIRSLYGYQSFLYYQLKNHFFKEDMIGGGAIFAAVTKKDMENQLLLCPPNHLIEDFEQNSKPIDEQLKTLYLQNQKLQQARDLLLPRLMNGEIPV